MCLFVVVAPCCSRPVELIPRCFFGCPRCLLFFCCAPLGLRPECFLCCAPLKVVEPSGAQQKNTLDGASTGRKKNTVDIGGWTVANQILRDQVRGARAKRVEQKNTPTQHNLKLRGPTLLVSMVNLLNPYKPQRDNRNEPPKPQTPSLKSLNSKPLNPYTPNP